MPGRCFSLCLCWCWCWDGLMGGELCRLALIDVWLAWADPTLKTWGDVSHNWINPGHCNAVQSWCTSHCSHPSRPHRGRALDRAGLFHGCGGWRRVHWPNPRRLVAHHRTGSATADRSPSLKLGCADRCGLRRRCTLFDGPGRQLLTLIDC